MINGEGFKSTHKLSFGVADKFLHVFQDFRLAVRDSPRDSLDDAVFKCLEVRLKYCSGYWLLITCFHHSCL